MKRLVLSEAARKDLSDIGAYSEETWGLAQKSRYLTLLKESFRRLQQGSSLGQPRDEVRPGYRSLACGRHVVFYRETGETLEIVRVLHQRMDVHLHLRDGGR